MSAIANVITVPAEDIIAGDVLVATEHPVLSVGPHPENAEWVSVVVTMEDEFPSEWVLERTRLIEVVRTEAGA